MKKADAVVLKETKYIAGITLILSVCMQIVFLALGKWTVSHLLGNSWGAFFSVLNFFLMGITVQNAVTKEEKDAKNLIKISQSARLFGLLVIALIGHLIPVFNSWAVLLSLLFPRIAFMLRPFIIKD